MAAEDEAIGANVRKARTDRGLSQAELARRMYDAGQTHWRQNTVSRVENGKQPLNAGEIQALAAILEKDLLEGSPVFGELKNTIQKMAPALKTANTRAAIRQMRRHFNAAKEEMGEVEAFLTILEATWWSSDDSQGDGESS